MTNAEIIRNMSNEDLASFLATLHCSEPKDTLEVCTARWEEILNEEED